jgi:uncharacterized membrane protein YphA (DoxX/SURF4 family)
VKARTIGYWVTTGLLALMFAVGGVMDVGRGPQVAEGLGHLGYPLYFALLLGIWKVLGAIAILAPKFPRLKEWAYAGMFFDLTGAAFSHASSGDDAGKVIAPLVFVVLLVASWVLRPSSRVLGEILPETPPASGRFGEPARA